MKNIVSRRAPKKWESIKSANLRRRPSPSRPRLRQTAPSTYILPDIGLTCTQLAALAAVPDAIILKCARDLDNEVFDKMTVLPPAIVDLVAEELHLHLAFRPQTVSLLPPSTDSSASKAALRSRMPVITVMGHVDHGKTSLLDALRKTDVAKNEHGGITQSVAAFRVPMSMSKSTQTDATTSFATFIDTPGHAAFSAMRANGTIATDIVVLVVAADDGVMPQTIEAANLARSTSVPIIVAVNKCDVEGADADRVRFQLLQQLELNTEQLGGDVLCVDISAKTGVGLPMLLEAIALQAELLELNTNTTAAGRAICLESRLDRSLGRVSTVVVRSGMLKKGDYVAFQNGLALHGQLYGRVRMLLQNDLTESKEAGPGYAVGIVGIRDSILPGSEVCVMKDEKAARAKSQEVLSRNSDAMRTIEVANQKIRDEQERAKKALEEKLAMSGEATQAPQAEVEEIDGENDEEETASIERRCLHVIVKGDVKGSADAVAQCLRRLRRPDIHVRIVTVGVGDVSDMDLTMASAVKKSLKGSKDQSLIVAFNVKVRDAMRKMARANTVELLQHSIIYHVEDVVKEMVQKMEAEIVPLLTTVGKAAVVRVFENGSIAGCSIQDGVVKEGAMGRVMRLPEEIKGTYVRGNIFTGEVESIKQFAKAVQSVGKGSECGISLKGWSTFAPGDEIHFVEEVKHE